MTSERQDRETPSESAGEAADDRAEQAARSDGESSIDDQGAPEVERAPGGLGNTDPRLRDDGTR